MAKEILLYSSIYDFTAERFIKEMEDASDEDVNVSMDTNGGDPQSSFGMIRKFQEHKGQTRLDVHGRAYSMGAFFPCYANYTTALDVSDFIFHRAALSKWVENDTELLKVEEPRLKIINNHLRAALEAKIDIPKFERITGTTLDQLFSMDGRVDVRLSSKQAKQVKLIDEIIPITPEIQASVKAYKQEASSYIAAHFDDSVEPIKAKEELVKIETLNKDMDIKKLQTEHPSVYAEILDKGIAVGVEKEFQRAGAFMVFADTDLKGAMEGIKAKADMTTIQMTEFNKKSVSAQYLKDTEDSNTGTIVTGASEDGEGKEKTPAEIKAAAELKAFREEYQHNLSL